MYNTISIKVKQLKGAISKRDYLYNLTSKQYIDLIDILILSS